MRKLSDLEMLTIKELLQGETNGLIKAKMTQASINDPELKEQVAASIMSCEERIRGFQQFINENKIMDPSEVH